MEKKNGKGIEYCDGEILFQGEYLRDQKINGLEYDYHDLVFEGKYLYEKNGKEYQEKLFLLNIMYIEEIN